MQLMSYILALGAGFFVLVVCGDTLVRGATALARRAGLPPLIVGLTVVAFGTSAPELLVSVQAVLQDAPRLAIGNIVGSNIANVLLVLGLPALIAPIVSNTPGVSRNAAIGLAAAVALILLTGPLSAPLSAGGVSINAWHGAALLAGLAVYLTIQARRAKAHQDEPEMAELMDIDSMEGLPTRWPYIWAFIVLGMIGLPIGSTLIVKGGIGLGGALGVPNEIIGLTAVAFGTSLPELAATFVAARRRHTELAIGNVLGSNIFNICAVGGAAAIAGTIPIPAHFFAYDLWVMLASALVLTLIALSGRPIGWRIGALFLIAYGAYIYGLSQLEGFM